MLVPYLALAMKRLSLVLRLSATEYPPFLLARQINSLERVNARPHRPQLRYQQQRWRGANYGRDDQAPHDERYERADEFADLVTTGWDAWDPDAVVLGRVAPLSADGGRGHAVRHEGKYFRCSGPLNWHATCFDIITADRETTVG